MSRLLRSRLLGPPALLLASLVLTFLVLEAAVRLLGVYVGTVQINRATVRRSANPRLRFELRPGARVEAEVEYRINSSGMRGPELSEAKPAGAIRVAVLGDSIAFGYWVSEEQAFPRQLEALLRQAVGPRSRVEVLDFGVPGYNLDQEIETLRASALRFAPDVVVVAFCLNDLEGLFSYEYGLTMERAERERSWPGRALEGLLRRSRLFSWIEYRLVEREARRRFARARNPLAGPLYERALEEQKRDLLARFSVLAELLKPRDISGFVAIFPALGSRFGAYPYRELHAAVAEAARAAGLVPVDLLDCYRGYDPLELRVDVMHPNPMGHRVAAHALRDALCAHGLACTGPAPEPARCTDYRRSDFPSVRGY